MSEFYYDGYTFLYHYHPGEPEVWTDQNGDPGTPGTGDEVEIVDVIGADSFGSDLTDKVQELILERGF